MKNLRKIAVLMVALVMAFAMTACGGKEQSVSYQLVQESDGLVVTDNITLDAKGDVVQKMTEKIVVDTTAFDATQKEAINAVYDEMVAMYQAVDGVECTGTAAENSYTIDIVIDATGSAVEELAAQGLLQMEGTGNGISLKASQAGFEASGYTIVE